MRRARLTSLGLSVAAHASVALVLALAVGRQARGLERGRVLRVELPRVAELAAATSETEEPSEPAFDPAEAPPTVPRLADPPHPPEEARTSDETLLPTRAEADERDRVVLPDVPVTVAGRPKARPRPAAPPRAPVAPPVAAPAMRTAPEPPSLVAIHRPRQYPPEAWRAGLEGRARVEVTIDARGRVVATRLRTSSGHAVLDRAALASARQWRFRPPGRTRYAVIPFTYELP